jgi:uncharacterized membrane protein (DUF373 family)
LFGERVQRLRPSRFVSIRCIDRSTPSILLIRNLVCKVIILDIKSMEPLTLLGVAAIILALTVGYYGVKKGSNT